MPWEQASNAIIRRHVQDTRLIERWIRRHRPYSLDELALVQDLRRSLVAHLRACQRADLDEMNNLARIRDIRVVKLMEKCRQSRKH